MTVGGGEAEGLIVTLALKIPSYSNQRAHRASYSLRVHFSILFKYHSHHNSKSSARSVLILKDCKRFERSTFSRGKKIVTRATLLPSPTLSLPSLCFWIWNEGWFNCLRCTSGGRKSTWCTSKGAKITQAGTLFLFALQWWIFGYWLFLDFWLFFINLLKFTK